MQTTIKDDFDAGLPGDLAVLPSFRSSARVTSRRAGGEVAPGDASTEIGRASCRERV